tara:strand:+ start:1089 stop:1508 length:420 start_codon:yes stop_codon:yes gene_type:complete
MLKNLFKQKQTIDLINTHEVDVALRLMFEIAISDGKLDREELQLIKERAQKIAPEELKISKIIKKIIDETEDSVSIYSTIKKVNETHSLNEKKDLLAVLWEIVAADNVIDPYEENLYFKIAELIKVKRTEANQIKHQNS